MIHIRIYIYNRGKPMLLLYSYFIGFILNIAGQTSLTGQISPLIWRMTSEKAIVTRNHWLVVSTNPSGRI